MQDFDAKLRDLVEQIRIVAIQSGHRSTVISTLLDLAKELTNQMDHHESHPPQKSAEYIESYTLRIRETKRSMPSASQQILASRIYRARTTRNEIFDDDYLFSEPVWDILLDLLAAEKTQRPVCITSAIIAARVPPTTALRWITILIKRGYVIRSEDDLDGRRSFLTLSDKTRTLFNSYFIKLSDRGLV